MTPMNFKKKNRKSVHGVFCLVIIIFAVHTIILETQPKNEMKTSRKQINLVDTSSDLMKPLTFRQSCAFESAAMMNPDSDVNIHFTSKERYVNMLDSSPIVLMLTTMYPNIRIFNFDLHDSSIGSPAEEFMKSGKLETSKYPMEHTSDMARLLILWKYPGTYLDSDVIVQKSIQNFSSNFIYQEHEKQWFAGGVMRMEKQELIKAVMEYFVNNFSPNDFASNGPLVMTETIKLLCNLTNISDIIEKGSCQDFHFLSWHDCYEIYYPEWEKFFKPEYADEVMMRTKNSSIVHFWNFLSRNMTIEKTSDVAYIRIARKFCPQTLRNTVDFF